MHKYTQAEFDALPVIDGWKQCPTGDYCAVKVFRLGSSFGARSSFGAGSSFGEGSSFGAGSSFGEGSSFGARSSFGAGSSFGAWSSFGARSSFGEWSSFGAESRFGKEPRFENGKKPRTTNPYMAVDRIGSALRKAYFFDFEDGLFVRAGCFFGSKDEFLEKLHADGDARKTRAYTLALELAEHQFGLAS